MATSICIEAGPKEAGRATGVVWGTKGSVVGQLFPKPGVGGDFLFLVMFKQTIITPKCLGDGVIEGRRVCECQ